MGPKWARRRGELSPTICNRVKQLYQIRNPIEMDRYGILLTFRWYTVLPFMNDIF